MDHAPNSTAPREKSIWPMFAGAFVLFALFALGVQWMLSSGDPASYDEEAIRAKERYDILAKIEEENKALITGYGWADQAQGTVRIPLERAMELTVARLAAQGEPRPAYPVDPNVPLGSAVKPGGLAAAQPTPPPFHAPAAAPEPAPDQAATPAATDPAVPATESPAAP
jgi:hypothetical protein